MFYVVSSQTQSIQLDSKRQAILLHKNQTYSCNKMYSCDTLFSNECSHYQYHQSYQVTSIFWILSSVIWLFCSIIAIFPSLIKQNIELMIQYMWHCLSSEWIAKNINHGYNYITDIHFQAYLVSKRARVLYDIDKTERIAHDAFEELPRLEAEFDFPKQHRSAFIYCIFHLFL